MLHTYTYVYYAHIHMYITRKFTHALHHLQVIFFEEFLHVVSARNFLIFIIRVFELVRVCVYACIHVWMCVYLLGLM